MISMKNTSIRFQFIQESASDPNNPMSIGQLCELLGVSRSGYYRYINAEESRKKREERDLQDFELILAAYKYRGYSKGARSIHMRLLHQEEPVRMNVKKIRRLMQKYHLTCPVRKRNPYSAISKALRTNIVADNLVDRNFTLYGPRKVLLTDITYIPYDGIFAYLSTIMDAYTRQILSYVLSPSLEVDFVLETVNQLIENHSISLSAETMIHSDQGCHYTSYRFIDLVRDSNLRQSMSRKGNCWDNAPQESFFGHMKDDLDFTVCETFSDVKEMIDDWMDYYNNDRYQWQLSKLSPNEYYQYITSGVYPLLKT